MCIRDRVKVFIAMENWQAALADVQLLYDAIVNQAALMGMRTQELDEVEQMRAKILKALEPADSSP